MRRTLNIRFLLCLVAGLIVASGGVALAHHLQYRRIPLALLRQAQKAEDEHDVNRTAMYIALYLDFEPTDIDQKARLARLLLSKKKPSNVVTAEDATIYTLLQYVLARDATRHDLRRLLIPVAIKLNELPAADEHLKLLPEDGDKSGLQARLYEAKGKDSIEAAITSYREAVKLKPADTEIVTRLARLLRSRTWTKLTPEESQKKREADAREADEVVDNLIKAAPNSWEARLARWAYRRNFYLFEPSGEKPSEFIETVRSFLIKDAVEDVTRALELREGEADVRLAAAAASQMEDQYETARNHLEKALQLHRRDPRVYQAFATLELEQEQKEKRKEEEAAKRENTPKPATTTRTVYREKALNWLKQGTQELKPPDQTALLWDYIVLLLDTSTPQDLDEAATMIGRIRQQAITPAGADYLQGRLLMGRQQWAEAARLLSQARPALTDTPGIADQIDRSLGRCYEELNDTKQRYDACKRLYDRNPTSLSALLEFIQAARADNKLDEALRLGNQALQNPDVPHGIWIDQFRVMVVKAVRSNGDWQSVEQSLVEAKSRNLADDVEIAILRTESLVAQEKPEEARRVLTEARKKMPDRAELWAAAVALEQRLKSPDNAEPLLDEADRKLEKSADMVVMRLARAGYWVNRHDKRTREELKKLSDNLDRFKEPRERYRLLHGLADANYRAGNTAEAKRLWQVLAGEEHYQSDLRLRLILFDLALQEGNQADMTALLKVIRRLEGGDGAFARHAEALRLIWLVKNKKVEKKDRAETLAEASQLLEQVIVARATWAPPLIARGEIEMLRGNPDQAIAAYEKAFTLGDRSPSVIRQIVEAKRRQPDGASKAQLFLQRVTQEERNVADLEKLSYEVALQSNVVDDQIRIFEEKIRGESGDYRDHLWLGRLLASTGKKPELAEEALRKAVDLERKEAETWVALVRFLASQNDKRKTEQARNLLSFIPSSVEPEASSALAMAQCHSVLGDGDKARDFYEQAVKLRPADAAILGDYAGFRMQRNELKEAEVLVRRMLEENVQKTPEETEWAHGRLAVLLSSGDDIRRFKEALPHVGLKMDPSGEITTDDSLVRSDSVTMRRLAARVLASNPLWRCREEAIKRFEELNQRQALNADERFIISRLYEAKGDWARAQNELTALGGARERKPHHVIAQIQGHLNNSQPAPAGRLLDALEKAFQDQPWPGGEAALKELRARWHEARHEGDKAITLLREFADRQGADPRDVLLVASSLARQKKYADGLAMADQLWKRCPSEMAGGTCVALLRSTKPSEQQIKQVETFLRAAVKKDEKNVNLTVQLGDVLDLAGNYEEAESLYREALKREPENVMVLNNLAWLLALRTQHGEEALELINRAIASVGPRGELLDTRSVVYLTLKKNDEARADVDEALKDSPTGTRYFHLARIQQAASNRDAARRTMVQAKDLGLEPGQLHPVEQVAHRKLTEVLEQQ
jgi:tetratricopeptide (TPR) repeat protein